MHRALAGRLALALAPPERARFPFDLPFATRTAAIGRFRAGLQNRRRSHVGSRRLFAWRVTLDLDGCHPRIFEMVPVRAAALLARPRCLAWVVTLTLLVAFVAPAAVQARGSIEQFGAGEPLFRVPAVGLQVRPPRGWYATGRALAKLVAPRPVLALASFSLAGVPTQVGDCPRAALQRRGSRGVLVVLFEERDEHYLNRFPPRPSAFRVHLSATGCYGPRGEELTFRSHGRAFYAFVSVGSAAPRDSVRLLEATLNSLRIAARDLHPLVFRDRNGGLAFAYPALWSATRTRLDAIVSPPQLVAVASYPLAVRPSKDSCPHAALVQRPPDGVFVQLREETNHRTAQSFPRRPRHFQLPKLSPVECYGPRSAAIRFRVAGRGFYAFVSFGPRATATTRRTTLRTLDGLHISPS
jgi:hypothetical protein